MNFHVCVGQSGGENFVSSDIVYCQGWGSPTLPLPIGSKEWKQAVICKVEETVQKYEATK